MIDEKYLAAMDLGSTKTALAVAKVSGNDVQIVYYKETPSEGMLNSIVNSTRASGPILKLIQEAENELKLKIRQVVVNLPKYGVKQVGGQGKMERLDPDESISEEEIEILKTQALDAFPLDDPKQEAMYGAIAQSFSADDHLQFGEKDIIGVISDTLEGNFKLFIGKRRSIKTIQNIYNKLDIAIANEYFPPVPQANVILTEEEMYNGVALIDFGGGSTSVSIYKGGILRHFASIPFGGNEITGDIRTICEIPLSLAENIKKAYGMCMPEKLSILSDKVLQIEGKNNYYKRINVSILSDIITCRMEEILDAMLFEIERSGYADVLRGGIVITGGGARLGNLVPFIKEHSGYNVKIGNPRPLFRLCETDTSAMSPSATLALGMIMAAKSDGCANCLDEAGDYSWPVIHKNETPVKQEPTVEEKTVETKPVEAFVEEKVVDIEPPKPLVEEKVVKPFTEEKIVKPFTEDNPVKPFTEEKVVKPFTEDKPVKVLAEDKPVKPVTEEKPVKKTEPVKKKVKVEEEDDDPDKSMIERMRSKNEKKQEKKTEKTSKIKFPFITFIKTSMDTFTSSYGTFMRENKEQEDQEN